MFSDLLLDSNLGDVFRILKSKPPVRPFKGDEIGLFRINPQNRIIVLELAPPSAWIIHHPLPGGESLITCALGASGFLASKSGSANCEKSLKTTLAVMDIDWTEVLRTGGSVKCIASYSASTGLKRYLLSSFKCLPELCATFEVCIKNFH
ncbi:hypothetical protein HNY73_006511 [Argiope bruennichi]|uniref:Uncharacterized protein n=1 Tax=Argiope bruennichi TaxID=94029 RepID=A0A8T0FBD0_ARGBR|nr:hypothetical protein HNY73_006511 [Argiope bruennichi]